jgi:hypothetical protein
MSPTKSLYYAMSANEASSTNGQESGSNRPYPGEESTGSKELTDLPVNLSYSDSWPETVRWPMQRVFPQTPFLCTILFRMLS